MSEAELVFLPYLLIADFVWHGTGQDELQELLHLLYSKSAGKKAPTGAIWVATLRAAVRRVPALYPNFGKGKPRTEPIGSQQILPSVVHVVRASLNKAALWTPEAGMEMLSYGSYVLRKTDLDPIAVGRALLLERLKVLLDPVNPAKWVGGGRLLRICEQVSVRRDREKAEAVREVAEEPGHIYSLYTKAELKLLLDDYEKAARALRAGHAALPREWATASGKAKLNPPQSGSKAALASALAVWRRSRDLKDKVEVVARRSVEAKRLESYDVLLGSVVPTRKRLDDARRVQRDRRALIGLATPVAAAPEVGSVPRPPPRNTSRAVSQIGEAWLETHGGEEFVESAESHAAAVTVAICGGASGPEASRYQAFMARNRGHGRALAARTLVSRSRALAAAAVSDPGGGGHGDGDGAGSGGAARLSVWDEDSAIPASACGAAATVALCADPSKLPVPPAVVVSRAGGAAGGGASASEKARAVSDLHRGVLAWLRVRGISKGTPTTFAQKQALGLHLSGLAPGAGGSTKYLVPDGGKTEARKVGALISAARKANAPSKKKARAAPAGAGAGAAAAAAADALLPPPEGLSPGQENLVGRRFLTNAVYQVVRQVGMHVWARSEAGDECDLEFDAALEAVSEYYEYLGAYRSGSGSDSDSDFG